MAFVFSQFFWTAKKPSKRRYFQKSKMFSYSRRSSEVFAALTHCHSWLFHIFLHWKFSLDSSSNVDFFSFQFLSVVYCFFGGPSRAPFTHMFAQFHPVLFFAAFFLVKQFLQNFLSMFQLYVSMYIGKNFLFFA